MDYQDIIYDEKGGIATMTLNRPDKMNAFSTGMRESMYRVVEHISQDKRVRVLIITGAGRAFCSGADVQTLAGNANRPTNQERPAEMGSERLSVHVLMQKCEKPIIAAINGVAAGAGLDLAMATWSDDDVWAYHSRFGLPHSAIYDKGHRRNGCWPCLMDFRYNDNKLSILHNSHPKLWNFLVVEKGLGKRILALKLALSDDKQSVYNDVDIDKYVSQLVKQRPCYFDHL